MSKRKRVSAVKARPAAKIRRRAAHQVARRSTVRAHSKQMRVVGLLSRPGGATIAGIMQSTGWQPHSVRGFLAAVVRKELGLKLVSEKTDGPRVYRIADGHSVAEPGA